MTKIEAPAHLSRVPQPQIRDLPAVEIEAERDYWRYRKGLYADNDPILPHYEKLIARCDAELERRAARHA